MSDIEERVKKIVVEHLSVEEEKISESASFIDDLGADSLDTVELVMAFEEEFGVEIPDDPAAYDHRHIDEELCRAHKPRGGLRELPELLGVQLYSRAFDLAWSRDVEAVSVMQPLIVISHGSPPRIRRPSGRRASRRVADGQEGRQRLPPQPAGSHR